MEKTTGFNVQLLFKVRTRLSFFGLSIYFFSHVVNTCINLDSVVKINYTVYETSPQIQKLLNIMYKLISIHYLMK